MSRRIHVIQFIVLISLTVGFPVESIDGRGLRCLDTERKPMPIGAVIDYGSRVGREQRVAIKMAVLDHSSLCNSAKMDVFFYNSEGNSTRAVAGAMDLIHEKRVELIIGTMARNEVHSMFSDVSKTTSDDIPIVSLTSPAMASPSVPLRSFPLVQMADDAVYGRRCISAIVGHFQWRKVTVIHPKGGGSELISLLSDSLRKVNSEIEHEAALSLFSSLSETEAAIEDELKKLRKNSNNIFMVTQFALEHGILLLQKAKKMKMMGKGYVWIVTDEIASFLDSVEFSEFNDMEGVIGVRTSSSAETSEKSLKDFNEKFRQIYRSEYPQEQDFSDPTIFSLRCYDAFRAVAQAFDDAQENITSKELLQKILQSRFQGLSGQIRFDKNGVLSSTPTFQIIKFAGKRYEQIAFWSPRSGFSETLMEENPIAERTINGSTGFLQSINCGTNSTRKARSLIEEYQQTLKFAVPAGGACKSLVEVSYNRKKEVVFSGYSIDVFEAVVKSLPLRWNYTFVPFNGTYNDMLAAVSNESFDGAVGDITVSTRRLKYVDFSQPYLSSNLVMVVRNAPIKWKRFWNLLAVFTWKTWLVMISIHLLVSATIWLIERGSNVELKHLGDILWFSVSVIFFAHREPIKKNLARFVLAPWLFSILILTACFTASLAAKLIIDRNTPSISTIAEAQARNVGIGCNQNSLFVKYLTDVLNFKPENIKNMTSIDEYDKAFKSGQIGAAFLMAPHAKVFVANYCQGYVLSESVAIGGIAFAFKKESSLDFDISKGLLGLLERRKLPQFDLMLLSSFNCSSETFGDTKFGLKPFAGMFIITGGFAIFALLWITIGIRLGLIVKPSKHKQRPLFLRRNIKLVSAKSFNSSRYNNLSSSPRSPNA